MQSPGGGAAGSDGVNTEDEASLQVSSHGNVIPHNRFVRLGEAGLESDSEVAFWG